MIGRCLPHFILAIATFAHSSVSFAQVYQPKERFLAMVSDGTRLKSDKIVNWFDEKSNPQIGGHSIFDANRPIRWIIDQAVELGPAPQAMLEFFGGDQLPARVIDYHAAEPDSFENLGEYLMVKPTISIDLPNQPPSDYVRVSLQWLRRIVFDRRAKVSPRYQPGTVFLRDGSQIKYKVARWGYGTLSVLTTEGIQSLVLGQISEVHFPLRDNWDVWFEQLASIDPQLDQRLLQVETSAGARLTTSRQRLRPLYSGDRNKSEFWYSEFQPGWSHDPLVIPFKTIRQWRFFSALEPPVTMFEPSAKRDGIVFSAGWEWQRNQSVQRTSLINNALHFGWGLGVHAPTALSLPLHPVVTHFRSRIGLDQVATKGGCARGIVSLQTKTSAELQRTAILIGSQALHDTNWVALKIPPQEASSLVLFADPVITDRPAKADPFDIRDSLDWCEPEWRLDKVKLQAEVAKRIPLAIPSLAGWTLHNQVLPIEPAKPTTKPATKPAAKPATKPALAVSSISGTVYRDSTIAEDIRAKTAFHPVNQFAVAQRKFKLSKQAKWFVVGVSRILGSTPSWIQVRGNGQALGQGEVAERTSRLDPTPVSVSVAHLAGQDVEFEVVMIATGDKSNLDFRGARVLSHRPGLVQLFEDDPQIIKQVGNGEGELTLTETEPYKGKAALKLTGGDRFDARIKDFAHAIAEHPRLGEYRFLRFAWKKEGGQRIGFQLGYNGEIGPPEVINDNRKNRAVTPENAARQLARERLRDRRRGSRGPRERHSDNARGLQFGYHYDTGNDQSKEPVMRLNRKPPTAWAVHGRDLFGEFGAFNLTGLGFRCPDGTAAYFDHIYLARTQNDFQYLTDWDPQPPIEDQNVLAHAISRWQHQAQVQTVAPQFSLEHSGEPVQLLAEHLGKKNVVKTSPVAQGKPGILRAPLTVPQGKKTSLTVTAGRNVEAKADWQLVVKVGTETLHQSLVDEKTATEGWVTQVVDLSKFAGKNIVVEVHNNPTNWHYEQAYWSQVAIESK